MIMKFFKVKIVPNFTPKRKKKCIIYKNFLREACPRTPLASAWLTLEKPAYAHEINKVVIIINPLINY